MSNELIFCVNCDREATHFFDGDDTLAVTLCEACADAFEMGQRNTGRMVEPIFDPADVETVELKVHDVPMMSVAGMLDFCQRGASDPAMIEVAAGLLGNSVADNAVRALVERRIKHTVTDDGFAIVIRRRDFLQ